MRILLTQDDLRQEAGAGFEAHRARIQGDALVQLVAAAQVQHGVTVVVAQGGLGGARGGRGARIAEALAAVLGAQPAVPLARDFSSTPPLTAQLGAAFHTA